MDYQPCLDEVGRKLLVETWWLSIPEATPELDGLLRKPDHISASSITLLFRHNPRNGLPLIHIEKHFWKWAASSHLPKLNTPFLWFQICVNPFIHHGFEGVLIWTEDGVCIFFKFCNAHLIVVVAVSVLEPLRFGTAVDAWGRSGNIPGNGNMRMDRVIGRPHSARNMPTWLQHLALLFHRSISFYFNMLQRGSLQPNKATPGTPKPRSIDGYAYGFVIVCAYILNTHIHTYVLL